MIKICKCGKGFATSPSLLKVGKGKYCSRECYFTTPKREETCEKIGLANRGHVWSEEQKQRKRNNSPRGSKHFNWKGDNAKYRAIHMWVEARLGKANKCSNDLSHQSTRYHWANISGEYKRDITDWRELCLRCNLNDGVKIPNRLRIGGDYSFR